MQLMHEPTFITYHISTIFDGWDAVEETSLDLGCFIRGNIIEELT